MFHASSGHQTDLSLWLSGSFAHLCCTNTVHVSITGLKKKNPTLTSENVFPTSARGRNGPEITKLFAGSRREESSCHTGDK